MKKLIAYEYCLAGGARIIIYGIPRADGGIIVIELEYIAPVVPLAA